MESSTIPAPDQPAPPSELLGAFRTLHRAHSPLLSRLRPLLPTGRSGWCALAGMVAGLGAMAWLTPLLHAVIPVPAEAFVLVAALAALGYEMIVSDRLNANLINASGSVGTKVPASVRVAFSPDRIHTLLATDLWASATTGSDILYAIDLESRDEQRAISRAVAWLAGLAIAAALLAGGPLRLVTPLLAAAAAFWIYACVRRLNYAGILMIGPARLAPLVKNWRWLEREDTFRRFVLGRGAMLADSLGTFLASAITFAIIFCALVSIQTCLGWAVGGMGIIQALGLPPAATDQLVGYLAATALVVWAILFEAIPVPPEARFFDPAALYAEADPAFDRYVRTVLLDDPDALRTSDSAQEIAMVA